MKKFWQKLKRNVRDGNEKGAREAVLEDLFNDFNRNRWTIYRFNFFRGIFFGLGSVLGGTVVVAIIIAVLNGMGALVPAVSGFTQDVIDSMSRTAENASKSQK